MTDETDQQIKVRENRLRRTADRQGLRLEKSRRRDPRALDFGTYHLVDPATNTLVSHATSRGYGLSLDDVEKALNEGAIGYAAASDYIEYDNEAEARGDFDDSDVLDPPAERSECPGGQACTCGDLPVVKTPSWKIARLRQLTHPNLRHDVVHQSTG